MAVEWRVKATELANCNCDYGCPCQFNALPTHGNCHGLFGLEIEEGHFGALRLDGLRAVLLASTPGALHQGNGTMQLIIDERADAAQLEPLFRPIEFQVDVEARRGRVCVPGILELTGEPIRNPVTGAEHRVRIDLPDGFEFRIAEIGSGTTRSTAAVALNGLENSYGQFAHIHLSNHGVVD